ncbi:phosphatase PAP2 family protein [Candidatus Pacebacteria bacterium]|nr:phosphatase PAP2 family protein [Candidatus Paceibacterota bacterium]
MQSISRYFFLLKQLAQWQFVPLYLFGVLGTAGLVFSGLDWDYFVWMSSYDIRDWLRAADDAGFVLAFGLPPLVFLLALLTRKHVYRVYAAAITYSIVLGFTVSTFIKVFTGRTSPPLRRIFTGGEAVDNSHAFNFGFMQEQILGGWPSSHTTVATALATTLVIMLPIRWWYKVPIVATALFIGIGVTLGFHWLSEFVAGACLGVAIGLVVGRYYATRISSIFS